MKDKVNWFELIFVNLFRLEFYAAFFLSFFWILNWFNFRSIVPIDGWIIGFVFGMTLTPFFKWTPFYDFTRLMIRIHEKYRKRLKYERTTPI